MKKKNKKLKINFLRRREKGNEKFIDFAESCLTFYLIENLNETSWQGREPREPNLISASMPQTFDFNLFTKK